MDSLTSGFNITVETGFNQMLGFTEPEIKYLLEQTGIEETKGLINELRINYNGYLFKEDAKY